VAPAYAAMTYLLDGSTSQGALPDVSGSQMGYRFTRGGSTIIAVWDYRSASAYAVPKGAQVCDWMGNCSDNASAKTIVSAAPTYFVLRNK
jgi:hypothetical protein